MRILIDVTHPAHVQFFRPLLVAMRARGHEISITSRDKDLTVALLDAYGIEHRCLSKAAVGRMGLLWEMLRRVARLRREIERFRPDVVVAREGVYACQAGRSTGVPAITFDDTDDAPIQQALSFPFAWRVYTDRAYGRRVGAKHRTFDGVFQLAYLHPKVFTPDPTVLERAGLPPGERLIVCRLVGWAANHDRGHRGVARTRLPDVLARLSRLGRVVVSSEMPLPPLLEPYRIPLPPEDVHHLMAAASLYFGESPTMAVESALVGVPAVHVSTRRLWYTERLADPFGLITNVTDAEAGLLAAEAILGDPGHRAAHREGLARYLEHADDMTAVVLGALDEVPVTGGAR